MVSELWAHQGGLALTHSFYLKEAVCHSGLKIRNFFQDLVSRRVILELVSVPVVMVSGVCFVIDVFLDSGE